MDVKRAAAGYRQAISDYLSFNRTEQRGILVLSGILVCLVTVNCLLPSGTRSAPPDPGRFQGEIDSFEKEWRRAADSDSMARLSWYRHTSPYFMVSGSTRKDSARSPGRPFVVLDLNKADTLDLQQLRGIGPGFARRICAYRERLGGYYEVNQVLEVFGMDRERYGWIEAHLRVSTDSIRGIDLNRITFKELIRHPYFPFGVAKSIMMLRQQKKMFRSLEEVRSAEGITDSLWRRMVIYLRVVP